MCEKCVESAKKWYPKLDDKELDSLLVCGTCFPFGSPEQVDAQLQELAEKTDGTLHGALAYAEEENEKAMAHIREMTDEEEEG